MPIVRVLLATIAGACTAEAFTPQRWYLAIVGTAVLSWALQCHTRWVRVLSAFGFAVALYGIVVQWITIVGAAAGIALLVLCVVPWLLISLFHPHASHVLTALRLASIIAVIEVVHSTIPWGGFPWGLLAYSQVDGPLMPTSRVGGEVLTSMAVVLCGYALFALVIERQFAPFALALGVVTLSYLSMRTQGSESLIRVSVIQGNVPREGLSIAEQAARVFANHVAQTHQLALDIRNGKVQAPDLVIWPENAADGDPVNNREMFEQVQQVVDEVDAPVLVGAAVWDGEIGPYNAGILWLPQEGPNQRYEKRHLVPFGEYIPHRALLGKHVAKFGVPMNHFEPGNSNGIFTYNDLVFADVICFEVADDIYITDGVNGGARFMTVQSNNATYAFSKQPMQQLQITRYRAFEHARSFAVATTTGFSALIDPQGKVLAQTEEMKAGTLTADLEQNTIRQPIDRWGSGPWLIFAGLIVISGFRKESPWKFPGSQNTRHGRVK